MLPSFKLSSDSFINSAMIRFSSSGGRGKQLNPLSIRQPESAIVIVDNQPQILIRTIDQRSNES